MKSFLTDLNGVRFKVEAGDEADKLMQEFSDVCRKRAVSYGLYGFEDGMKSFVHQVYDKKYTEQIISLENRLFHLLYDKNPQIRLYLRSHPELKKREELAELYKKIEEKYQKTKGLELQDLAMLNASLFKPSVTKQKGFKEKEFDQKKMTAYVQEMS